MTMKNYAISCLITAGLFAGSIAVIFALNWIEPIIERTIGWEGVGAIFMFFVLSFAIYETGFKKQESETKKQK